MQLGLSALAAQQQGAKAEAEQGGGGRLGDDRNDAEVVDSCCSGEAIFVLGYIDQKIAESGYVSHAGYA